MDWQSLLRNLRGSTSALLSLCVIAGLLSGCIATLAPPAALSVGTGNANAPAMALAADGTKHIVWSECPQSGGCAIQYYRTKLGEPLVTQSFAPPGGADNMSPDIALAYDGTAYTAYIVWTTFYSSTSNKNVDAYAVVYADGSASGASNLDPNAGVSGDHTEGGPQVVARGNNVYGLYNVQGGFVTVGGASYRQLNPLDAHNGTVAGDSGCGIDPSCQSTVRAPKAILDSDGKLHVAYDHTICSSGSCTDVMYQADNTASANMSSTVIMSSDYLASDGSPFTAPDIAVAGNNSIFVTYSYSQTKTDAVIYATGTTFASPFVTATVPLTGALDAWRVEGNVHVAALNNVAVNNMPAVAFAAKNKSTGSTHEIWLFTQGDSNVTRITHLNGNQNEPLIATMGTSSAGVAVVGWRTWYQAFVLSCLGDGYEYDQVNQTVQKVYNNTGGCFSTGQALAANANWASAVWVDSMPQNTRLVPWLGFNANTTMLPLITR